MNTLQASQAYISRGWNITPIAAGSKRPLSSDWPNLRIAEADLPQHFSNGNNVGIVLGTASGGLVDVDLDCREARAAAPFTLPKTDLRHGRASSLASHRWYVCEIPTPSTEQFRDVDGSMLVELRATGGQTVAPPSIHPSGETLTWEQDGEPATIAWGTLRRRVAVTAAVAVLARHWPARGSRHDASLALAGVLVRNGRRDAAQFVQRVATVAGDDEARERGKDAETTAANLKAGRPVTGYPRFAEKFGENVAAKVREWLGLQDDLAGLDLDGVSIPTVEPLPTRQYPRKLNVAALHGPIGELVNLIEPHSEADPVAILVQSLAFFGNVLGRGPYLRAEARAHYSNIFVCVVAATSKGRKGSALAQVERVFRLVDEPWTTTRKMSGLSSGEGLIWTVRDPIEKQEAVKEKGRVIDYQIVIADPGIADKRVLFIEEELGGTLSVMGREGNSLSPTIRSAWDTGNLNTATKNTPARATGAHVSIIGHVTRDELLRNLNATEKANGFANRFLWVCAQRSKALPFGGSLSDNELARIVRQLRDAVDTARRMGAIEVAWSHAAAELWRSVYPALSEGCPGLLGAVTSRAEAQTIRLALLYALADESREILRPHLEAALALWDYALDSARFIFGDALGDPLGDEILTMLRRAGDAGMSRTAIRDAFGRNKQASDIARALETLAVRGMARSEPGVADGPGRRPEVWRAVGIGYDINDINDRITPSANSDVSVVPLNQPTQGNSVVRSYPPEPSPRPATGLPAIEDYSALAPLLDAGVSEQDAAGILAFASAFGATVGPTRRLESTLVAPAWGCLYHPEGRNRHCLKCNEAAASAEKPA